MRFRFPIFRCRRFSSLLLLATVAASAWANEPVVLPGVWTNGMVLQRDVPIPISGTAEANVQVTVMFGNQAKVAPVDAEGRWRTTLDPMPANAEPQTLRAISCCMKCSARLDEVVVGDVWVWGLSGDADATVEKSPGVIRTFSLAGPTGQPWQTVAAKSGPIGDFAGQMVEEVSAPVGLVTASADAATPVDTLGAALRSLGDFPVRGVLWPANSEDIASSLADWRRASHHEALPIVFTVPAAGQSAVSPFTGFLSTDKPLTASAVLAAASPSTH